MAWKQGHGKVSRLDGVCKGLYERWRWSRIVELCIVNICMQASLYGSFLYSPIFGTNGLKCVQHVLPRLADCSVHLRAFHISAVVS